MKTSVRCEVKINLSFSTFLITYSFTYSFITFLPEYRFRRFRIEFLLKEISRYNFHNNLGNKDCLAYYLKNRSVAESVISIRYLLLNIRRFSKFSDKCKHFSKKIQI